MCNVGEYADGQKDCRDGNAPRDNATEAYLDGYGFQYELEACQTAQAEAQEIQ